MALIDDLQGLLSPAEFEKIKGNTKIASRITRGDEYVTYYDGEETPPAASTAAVTPPATAVTAPPPAAFDLSGIERLLDQKLGKIDERIDARLETVVQARGNEMVNNAVRIATARADELHGCYDRYYHETGKPFDRAAFNDYLEKPENKVGDASKPIGHGAQSRFRSITEAYEQFTAPQSTEREVERRVAAKLAERSGQAGVPGTTPPPSGNSNLRVFMNRGKSGDGAGATGASRAAAALDKIMSRQQEQAS